MALSPLQRFPALPVSSHPWNWQIRRAHELVDEEYSRSIHLLREDDGDPERLRIQFENFRRRALPTFRSLVVSVSGSWALSGAQYLLTAHNALKSAMNACERRCTDMGFRISIRLTFQ